MPLEFSHDDQKSTAKDGEAVIAELLRNGHLTAAEIKLFRERYAKDRQKIIDETRNGLRGFVNSDIRQANEDYLSRPENTTKIRDIHDLQVALNKWLREV